MKKGLMIFCAVFSLFETVGMEVTASFRSIEEVNSLLQRDTRMVALQREYLKFIEHKEVDVELYHLATGLLSGIANCQDYIENVLSTDRELKRKEKDIIYMRALALMSSAICALKKRVTDLGEISVDNAQERTRVLDQISRL